MGAAAAKSATHNTTDTAAIGLVTEGEVAGRTQNVSEGCSVLSHRWKWIIVTLASKITLTLEVERKYGLCPEGVAWLLKRQGPAVAAGVTIARSLRSKRNGTEEANGDCDCWKPHSHTPIIGRKLNGEFVRADSCVEG